MTTPRTLFKIVAGNALIAIAVNGFILPAGFISGGSTGVALLLLHTCGIPFSMGTTLVLAVCFLAGLVCMGWRFSMSSALSTIIYPLLVTLTSSLSSFQITSDPLVAAVTGGVLCGSGLALVIQSGASTGGMDIPAIVLNKYFGINTSAALFVTDGLLLLAQMPTSTGTQIAMGLILTLVTSLWMNRILTLGKSAVQILVFSSKSDTLRSMLLHQENHGVSLFAIENGYMGTDAQAVCSVFPRKDLAQVRQAVYAVDPDAFMIVSNVQEVRGVGFKDWTSQSLKERIS